MIFYLILYMVSIRNRIVSLFIIVFSTAMLFSDNSTRGLLRNNNISPASIYSNQWALIIGVNEYPDFPQLKYAVEDAKSMKNTLMTQYGFPEENIELFSMLKLFIIVT